MFLESVPKIDNSFHDQMKQSSRDPASKYVPMPGSHLALVE